MLGIFSKKSKAFTLLELIVVIAIIAILVLVASPKLMGQTQKAKLVHIKNDVKAVETVTLTHMLEHGKLPDGNKITKAEMEDKVIYNKKGIVESIEDKNYTKLDDDFVKDNTKTKLDGDFVSDDDGDIIYVDTDKIKDNEDKPDDKNRLEALSINTVADFLEITTREGRRLYGVDDLPINFEINNDKLRLEKPGLISYNGFDKEAVKGNYEDLIDFNSIDKIETRVDKRIIFNDKYVFLFYSKDNLIGAFTLNPNNQPGSGPAFFSLSNNTDVRDMEMDFYSNSESKGFISYLIQKSEPEKKMDVSNELQNKINDDFGIYDKFDYLDGYGTFVVGVRDGNISIMGYNEEEGIEPWVSYKIQTTHIMVTGENMKANPSYKDFIRVGNGGYKHKNGTYDILTEYDGFDTTGIVNPHNTNGVIKKIIIQEQDNYESYRYILYEDGSMYGLYYDQSNEIYWSELSSDITIKDISEAGVITSSDNKSYRIKIDRSFNESIVPIGDVIRSTKSAYNKSEYNNPPMLIEYSNGDIYMFDYLGADEVKINKNGLTNDEIFNGYKIEGDKLFFLDFDNTGVRIEKKENIFNINFDDMFSGLKAKDIADIKIIRKGETSLDVKLHIFALDKSGNVWSSIIDYIGGR